MLRWYRQWYTFAVTKCHRNIKLYDLILVTGCDMSRQWATATYFRHFREMSAALGAQVAPVVEANFSLSAGWRTTQPVITRWGPPQALHQQTRPNDEGTQNDSETLVNDQCIFLRGLYVKERFLQLGPKVLKAGAGYHDPGKYGPEEEGVEGVLADEGVAVEALLPSTQVCPLDLRLAYIQEMITLVVGPEVHDGSPRLHVRGSYQSISTIWIRRLTCGRNATPMWLSQMTRTYGHI
jgi:hypothetical protein